MAAIESELLRRRVGELAGEIATDDGTRVGIGQLGDAEIDDLGMLQLAARKDHIVRRHVAVDDALLVRRAQPHGKPVAQQQHIMRRQRAVLEQDGQCRPVDIFHDQV